MSIFNKKTQRMEPLEETEERAASVPPEEENAQSPPGEEIAQTPPDEENVQTSSDEGKPMKDGTGNFGKGSEDTAGKREEASTSEEAKADTTKGSEGVTSEGPEAEEQEAEEPEEIPEEPARPVKANRRRRHKKKNWILRILLVIVIIGALLAAASLPAFWITDIAVIGNKAVSDKKIIKLSGLEKGKSIFLFNPWLVSHNIKQNYYIEDVNIDRHLPGTVDIIVKEREAAAQFAMRIKKDKKRYVCINQEGMVLGRSKKKKKVTMVTNVKVLHAEKGSMIEVDDTGVYHRSMNLIHAAKEGDLYFKRIFVKGSLVHAYIYDDLMCTGRYDNVMESLRNGTLKTVVYKLYQEDVDKGTINIGDNNYCSFTP